MTAYCLNDGTNYNCVGGSSSGSGITALTGDVTAAGTGSVAATLATVNSAPGSCGDATHVCQVTTNGKGLVTAQSAVAITSSGSSPNTTKGDLHGFSTHDGAENQAHAPGRERVQQGEGGTEDVVEGGDHWPPPGRAAAKRLRRVQAMAHNPLRVRKAAVGATGSGWNDGQSTVV